MLEDGKEKAGFSFPGIFRKQYCPQRSVRRQVKDPKRRKSKSPRRLFGRMKWKIHLSLFPNPRKKNLFPGRSWSVVILKRGGTGNLPKRKKSFPKEEPVTDPDESENKRVPKKKRKLSSKEEPLSSGPEEAAASKSSGSKKKKKSLKASTGK